MKNPAGCRSGFFKDKGERCGRTRQLRHRHDKDDDGNDEEVKDGCDQQGKDNTARQRFVRFNYLLCDIGDILEPNKRKKGKQARRHNSAPD